MSAPVAAGVRVELLRAGRSDESLFLVPGLEGDPDELADLAAAVTGPQAVYAVAPTVESEPGLTAMATALVTTVRGMQPEGPYRLGGYSFGGLVAFEMAQQLRAAGETVESLFLIDALFDERYWPRRTWLRALARRTGWQLLRIVRMPPLQAAAEFRHRGVRLVQRFRRRDTDAVDTLRPAEPETPDMAAGALAALSGYRPRYYDGEVTLIASAEDRHFGADTGLLWDGLARQLHLQRIAGDHLTVMQRPESAAVIAHMIDHRLATRRPDFAGLRPVPGFERPMIVSTMRWFSAARLAHALSEAGFAVSACRPVDHPLDVLEGALIADHRLRRGRRLASLEAAIRQTRPDLLLPDDERAWALIRRLHAHTGDLETRVLIERSLGHLDDWEHISSRASVAQEAQKAGAVAPDTQVVTDPATLAGWSYPLVLKTDGSWGGRGVAVVRDESRLGPVFARISRPMSYPRALKRLVVNRETEGLTNRLRGRRPVVNVQQHVDGPEAIATVVCQDGLVRDLICLEVVRATRTQGPAEVVRVIDHPGMAATARHVVKRFGLSGFCGMDFLIGADGEAYLVELNSRVTPTCHLLVEGGHPVGQVLTLFPADCETVEQLDVPRRSLALAELGERTLARRARPLTRRGRRLAQRLNSPKY
jgi:thioesterase domain-containing protein